MRLRLATFLWWVLIAGLALVVVLEERRSALQAQARERERWDRMVLERFKAEDDWERHGGCILPEAPFLDVQVRARDGK